MYNFDLTVEIHPVPILPATRNYEGCRYCNTLTQANNPQEILLIEGWDSRSILQRYMQWRQETGSLDELLSLLAEPPKFEFWNLNEA